MKTGRFTGFTQEGLHFLESLQENNNKTWFEANKQLYTDYLIQPMQRLVLELSETMLAIDPYLEMTPAVGKTISRIYRDTRFSRDKSPYRTNIWIALKRPAKDWKEAPAFFFELYPSSYRYGMGFFAASKLTMDNLREMMDTNPHMFQQMAADYANQSQFTLEGETYKRVLDPTKPPELLQWYQRKNLYFVCNRSVDDRLFSREILNELQAGFGALSNLYHDLYELKNMGQPHQ